MRRLLCGLLLAGLLVVPSSRIAAGDDAKPEPGFTPLFNGKNLNGWKTKEGETLEGKTEAYNGRFKVMDGILVIDPKVKGDKTIYSTKEFGKDVIIKFEFLPGPGCNNDLYFRGIKFDLVKSNVKNMKEGEWNTLEIILQGNKIEYKNNGETQRKNDAKSASSPLGIRAEYNAVQIKNLRYKEMP